MNVLFIHNTIAEYRIPFFRGLNSRLNIDYLFTKLELGKQIYGTEIEKNILDELNIKTMSKGIRKYLDLLKYVGSNKYEFIVIPPLDSFVDFIDVNVILFQAKRKGKKLLYFGEKWEAPRERQPILKRVKNFIQKCAFVVILKRIDMCIAAGSKSKEYFESCGINRNKISVAIDASGVINKEIIYNIRERHNITDDAKIILYYGRIIERKGLEILIKAWMKSSVGKNTYMLVCGDGPFKSECESLVKESKIKNIFFEGYVNPNNKYTFFSQCNIFVLPSYFYKGIPEAWGLTVNEALQCGKPVIVTNAVGAAYDLVSEKNGKIIRENNIEDLVDAIDELLSNNKYENMKKECEKTYENFNYNNMINGFIEAIKKIE